MTVDEKNVAAEILRISGVDAGKWMSCGKGSGCCPAYDAMDVRPHQVAAMVDDGNIGPLLSSNSLWKCVSCFSCVERCPRGVEPARLFEGARLMVIRKLGGNRLKPEDIPGLINDRIPQQAITAAFRKYSK
jgi:heterodisulfide reductase subunit C